jgi:hypothetical protein
LNDSYYISSTAFGSSDSSSSGGGTFHCSRIVKQEASSVAMVSRLRVERLPRAIYFRWWIE